LSFMPHKVLEIKEAAEVTAIKEVFLQHLQGRSPHLSINLKRD
jgi:hypothetical protein